MVLFEKLKKGSFSAWITDACAAQLRILSQVERIFKSPEFRMSACKKEILYFLNRSRLKDDPLRVRLSKTTTLCPAHANRSARLEPTKPQPPVIPIFIPFNLHFLLLFKE
jgi:hypothetical protein